MLSHGMHSSDSQWTPRSTSEQMMQQHRIPRHSSASQADVASTSYSHQAQPVRHVRPPPPLEPTVEWMHPFFLSFYNRPLEEAFKRHRTLLLSAWLDPAQSWTSFFIMLAAWAQSFYMGNCTDACWQSFSQLLLLTGLQLLWVYALNAEVLLQWRDTLCPLWRLLICLCCATHVEAGCRVRSRDQTISPLAWWMETLFMMAWTALGSPLLLPQHVLVQFASFLIFHTICGPAWVCWSPNNPGNIILRLRWARMRWLPWQPKATFLTNSSSTGFGGCSSGSSACLPAGGRDGSTGILAEWIASGSASSNSVASSSGGGGFRSGGVHAHSSTALLGRFSSGYMPTTNAATTFEIAKRCHVNMTVAQIFVGLICTTGLVYVQELAARSRFCRAQRPRAARARLHVSLSAAATYVLMGGLLSLLLADCIVSLVTLFAPIREMAG